MGEISEGLSQEGRPAEVAKAEAQAVESKNKFNEYVNEHPQLRRVLESYEAYLRFGGNPEYTHNLNALSKEQRESDEFKNGQRLVETLVDVLGKYHESKKES